jgi:hypothetical protein
MPEEAVYDYVVRSMIGKILNTMDSDQSYDIACKSLMENINKARASILKETRRHWKKVARQKFKIEIRKEINEYN